MIYTSLAISSPMIAINQSVRQQRRHSRRFVLTKVGECLYRSDAGSYFAVIKSAPEKLSPRHSPDRAFMPIFGECLDYGMGQKLGRNERAQAANYRPLMFRRNWR